MSIFTEADILKPAELVKALREAPKVEEASDSLPARLWKELPPRVKLLLDNWDKNSSGQAECLGELAEAFRVILNTANLPESGKSTEDSNSSGEVSGDSPVLWRENRGRLTTAFKGVVRERAKLSKLLFSSEPNYDEWRKTVEEALREPERRDCVQTAILRILDAWNAALTTELVKLQSAGPDRKSVV